MLNNLKTILIYAACSCFFMDYFVQDFPSIFININEIPINFFAFFISCLITILFLVVLFEKSLILAKLMLGFLSIFYLKLLGYLLYGKIILGNFWFLTFEKRSSPEEKLDVFCSIKNELFTSKLDVSSTCYKDIPAEILNINNIEIFSAKLNLFLNSVAVKIPADIVVSSAVNSNLFYITIGLSILAIIIVGIIVYNSGSSIADVPLDDISILKAKMLELDSEIITIKALVAGKNLVLEAPIAAVPLENISILKAKMLVLESDIITIKALVVERNLALEALRQKMISIFKTLHLQIIENKELCGMCTEKHLETNDFIFTQIVFLENNINNLEKKYETLAEITKKSVDILL